MSRGLVYTAALTAPRIALILTLPLYTRAMSPAEFGRLALAVSITAAVVPLLSKGLETAVFRGWFDLADDVSERRRMVSTTTAFLAVVPNVIALLVLVISLPWTSGSDKLPTAYLALGLLGGALMLTATIVPLPVLQAQDRLRAYLRVSLVLPAVSVPLTILFVVVLDWGARGWLAGNLLGAAATIPVGLHAIRDQLTSELSREHLRGILRWSGPLVPHGLSQWTLATSDRLILARYVSLQNLGIYNIGYQIGMVLGLVFSALNNVVTPEYGRALKDAKHRGHLRRLVTYQVVAVVLLGLVMALLGPPVTDLVLPSEFAEVGDVIPWVALGYIFFGLYLIPMNRIVILGGDVSRIWIATALAAVSNIGLNLLFVPTGGIMAAAVNTAVSYLALFAAISIYAHRRHPTQGGYEWSRLAAALVALGAVYLVAVVASPEDPLLALAIRAAVLGAAAAGLLGYERRRA